MQLNREKAVRIMSLMDELRAELVGTFISVEGSTTAAEEEVKQEQSKTAHEFLAEIRASKTANQQRKEVIEKAKKFVKDVQEKEHDEIKTIDGEFYGVYFGETDRLKFVINEKKRTVVALIIGVISDCVYHRGIAKCNPSDVFNEHIGKAIALGRALDLDVSEFEKAVQPTELVVGHITTSDSKYNKHGQKPRVVKKLAVDGVWRTNLDGSDIGFVRFKELTIINDTNAQY